jgi:exodeoxyribonuclease-5
MAITLNTEQLESIRKMITWYYKDSYKKHWFVQVGGAGTGKSTIVSIAIKMLGIPMNNVIFCTLTGKASLVLRIKGNPSNTIHKTFYSVYKTRNSFGFHLKKHIDPTIKLIVVDEAAMVSQPMVEDILSFGTPTLFLGDSNQLPPIFGANKIMLPENADGRLTKPMRQSDSSGILDLAVKAINGEEIPFGQYKASKVVRLQDVIDDMYKYDMILTYSNATRRLVNRVVRNQLGFTSIYPQKGDKLLCLMNNYRYCIDYDDIPIYLINGLVGYAETDWNEIDYNGMSVGNFKFRPEFIENDCFDVKCFMEIFEQYTKDIKKDPFISELYDENIDDESLGDIGMIDYGYGLTVHKSQGSEAKNVLVLASDFKGPPDVYNKWLYTAVTRAKESVTIAYDI